MFCQNCGSKQPDDGLFCTLCGEKLPQFSDSEGALEITRQEAAVLQEKEENNGQSVQIAAEQQNAVQAESAIPETPVTGSYSISEDTAATSDVPVTGTYAAVPSETLKPNDSAQTHANLAASPVAEPLPPLSADLDSKAKPPKPPKVKREPVDQAQFFAGDQPKPKKGNGMYLAIIGTLAAVLIGVGVWLVITLGKVSKVNEEIANKDGKITELQQSVDSLTAGKQQDASTITTLQTNVASLQGQISEMQEKITFFDTYAAIVPDDKTKLYHTFECTHYDHSLSFLIYNVTLAKSEGYSPCPYCH